MILILAIAFALDMICAFPMPAGAYTDPSVGNLIFQILFPVITVLGMGYLILKDFIKKKFTSLKKRFKK